MNISRKVKKCRMSFMQPRSRKKKPPRLTSYLRTYGNVSYKVTLSLRSKVLIWLLTSIVVWGSGLGPGCSIRQLQWCSLCLPDLDPVHLSSLWWPQGQEFSVEAPGGGCTGHRGVGTRSPQWCVSWHPPDLLWPPDTLTEPVQVTQDQVSVTDAEQCTEIV